MVQITWLTTDWIQACLAQGSSANLAGLDGYLHMPMGWDTYEQRLDEWLLYYIYDGVVKLETEGYDQFIQPGSMVLIPAGQPFRMGDGQGQPCRFARCRLQLPPAHGALVVAAVHLRSLIEEMVDLAAHPQQALQAERIAALMVVMLGRLRSELPAEDAQRRLSLAQYHRLERWCAEHIRLRLSPSDIAEQLGLSLDYCIRLFSATYGCPPKVWLLQQRLRHIAVALNESDATLDAIAQSFGYNDQNLMG